MHIMYCADQGRAGQGRAGQGRAGQGRAGQGKMKAGQGKTWQGMAGQGKNRDMSMIIPVLMPQSGWPSCLFCLLQLHLPRLLLPATQLRFVLFTMSMRWLHSHCARTLVLPHYSCVKHLCLLE